MMKKKEYKCDYCSKIILGKGAYIEHKKKEHNIKNGQQPRIKCYCSFCGKEFNTRGSKNRHENYCIKNSNRKVLKGHNVSEEVRQKISSGMKLAHKKGRACEWVGRHERSYAEQSWYNIFANDFGEKTFINNLFVKKYWLDFAWPDKKIYFEVDGRTHFTEEGILHDKERTEFLKNEGWTLIGRCNWSEYQKLSKEDKVSFVKDIENKILTANPNG